MPFLSSIGIKLLAGLAAVGAVLVILAGARSAGKAHQKVKQYEDTLKAKHRGESKRDEYVAGGGATDSLRDGTF